MMRQAIPSVDIIALAMGHQNQQSNAVARSWIASKTAFLYQACPRNPMLIELIQPDGTRLGVGTFNNSKFTVQTIA